MKGRPMLFSAPMVRALLNGSKTQTRRTVKKHPLIDGDFTDDFIKLPENHVSEDCPYGQVGDLLWVRETWKPHTRTSPDTNAIYRADYTIDNLGNSLGPWRPSIYMPRWASRIALKITNVRVERLQDISEADAIAEGIEEDGVFFGTQSYKSYDKKDKTPCDGYCSYQSLWESINGEDSWDLNPWVWVIEFDVINQNVDEVLKAAA